MKLLQHLLVAPAALTFLIAPLSATAADLNIDSVSDFSATLDLEQAKQLLQQVTSVISSMMFIPRIGLTRPW